MNSSITAQLSSIALSRAEGQNTVCPRPKDPKESQAELPDDELMSHLLAGDSEALGLLFRRYARAVHSVAYKVLRDNFEADDLVQEIFLLIYRKCGDFDSSKGPARFWILQMAYHRAISRRRYLSCRHFYSHVELTDVEGRLQNSQKDVQRFQKTILASLDKSELEKTLKTLSENQRLTLKRHFFDGYTFEEIAAELGQTRGNVRHHYFRGLDKLRRQLFAVQSER